MSKIVDILAAGPSHSFEFFPPKTPIAEQQLEETLRDLEPLHPTFVSVTYGAGGTTREMTHHLVTRINRDTSLTAMAHLTCAAHTRAELTEIVTRYDDAGIRNILALLGDLRELGVTTRVIPGIMPVLNVKSVKRMAEMSGADFPRALEDRLRAVEHDEEAMRAVGIEAATELCGELMAGGVDSFHFYTL